MSVLRIVNKYNLTTEQVKGKPVEYKVDKNEAIPLGVLTHADENYLYVDFNGNEDLLIVDFGDSVSMEMDGE